MTNKQMEEFMSRYYIDQKKQEIEMERVKLDASAARQAAEQKNQEIADAAADELMAEMIERGMIG